MNNMWQYRIPHLSDQRVSLGVCLSLVCDYPIYGRLILLFDQVYICLNISTESQTSIGLTVHIWYYLRPVCTIGVYDFLLLLKLFMGWVMDNLMTFGLIAVAVLAVLGLGVKVMFNFKGGNKSNIKNVRAGGDVVGRDKVQK